MWTLRVSRNALLAHTGIVAEFVGARMIIGAF